MDREFIEELKQRSDPDKIASCLNLQKKGKRYFCPDCQPDGGKTPDLVVSTKGFLCFKCGIKGDLLDLIMTFGQMTFPQALEWLEADTGLCIPTGAGDIHQTPKSEPEISDNLKSKILMAFLDSCRPVENEALSWLVDEKGVTPEVIKSCHLRLCGKEYKKIMEDVEKRFGQVDVYRTGLLKPSNREPGLLVPVFWPYYASNVEFLVIPYLKNKLPVYLKSRPALGKERAEKNNMFRFLNMSGRIPCLYNVDALKKNSDRILICEGESDTWSALSQGLVAVGSPGAKMFKPQWVQEFKDCFRTLNSNVVNEPAAIIEYESGLSLNEADPDFSGEIRKQSTVYLVLDGDSAGQVGAATIEELFRSTELPSPHRVILPEGKDLSEFLREAGNYDFL